MLEYDSGFGYCPTLNSSPIHSVGAYILSMITIVVDGNMTMIARKRELYFYFSLPGGRGFFFFKKKVTLKVKSILINCLHVINI